MKRDYQSEDEQEERQRSSLINKIKAKASEDQKERTLADKLELLSVVVSSKLERTQTQAIILDQRRNQLQATILAERLEKIVISRQPKAEIHKSHISSTYFKGTIVKSQNLSKLPYNCIGKVVGMQESTKVYYSGIAFLIDKNIAVTSAHNLFRPEKGKIVKLSDLTFIIRLSEVQTQKQKSIKVIDCKYPEEYLKLSNEMIQNYSSSQNEDLMMEGAKYLVRYDYAVLLLKYSYHTQQISTFPKLSPGINKDQNVIVSGFMTPCSDPELNKNNLPLQQSLVESSGYVDVFESDGVGFYQMQTESGFSGTPVFYRSIADKSYQCCVVGIHKGYEKGRNYCTLISTQIHSRVQQWRNQLNKMSIEMNQDKDQYLQLQKQKQHSVQSYICLIKLMLYMKECQQRFQQLSDRQFLYIQLIDLQNLMNKAYQKYPNSWELLLLIGIIQFKEGNDSKAFTYLSKSIKANSLNIAAYVIILSNSQFQQYYENQGEEKNQQYLSQLLKYIQREKDERFFCDMGYYLCNIYFSQKQIKWGKKCLQIALRLDTQQKYHCSVYWILGFLKESLILYQKQTANQSQQQSLFMKALDYQPTDSFTSFVLGYQLLWMNNQNIQKQKIVELFEKAFSAIQMHQIAVVMYNCLHGCKLNYNDKIQLMLERMLRRLDVNLGVTISLHQIIKRPNILQQCQDLFQILQKLIKQDQFEQDDVLYNGMQQQFSYYKGLIQLALDSLNEQIIQKSIKFLTKLLSKITEEQNQTAQETLNKMNIIKSSLQQIGSSFHSVYEQKKKLAQVLGQKGLKDEQILIYQLLAKRVVKQDKNVRLILKLFEELSFFDQFNIFFYALIYETFTVNEGHRFGGNFTEKFINLMVYLKIVVDQSDHQSIAEIYRLFYDKIILDFIETKLNRENDFDQQQVGINLISYFYYQYLLFLNDNIQLQYGLLMDVFELLEYNMEYLRMLIYLREIIMNFWGFQ